MSMRISVRPTIERTTPGEGEHTSLMEAAGISVSN
jgi:hypothetical protein